MGNFTVAPRSPHTQQLPYFRRSVAFDTVEIGTAGKVPLGTLPAGAIVTGALVKVTEAFNAATTTFSRSGPRQTTMPSSRPPMSMKPMSIPR
jgi:hypothetical protein